MQSRREFLIRSSEFAAAGLLATAVPKRLFANALGKPIGLQLYTVGAQLDQDFEGTLKQIAAIGYTEVELAGAHGKKPAELKKSLDDVGLHCSSVHIGQGGIQESITYANELGAKYVISSVLLPKPPAKGFMEALNALTLDDYKSMAQKANEMGEQAKKAGLQFGYHNHNFEFKPHPEGTGYDTLLQSTDPELVKLELDCGWMSAAGHDPAAYLKKYPHRYRLLHIKDFKPTERPSVGLDPASRPAPAELGRGHVDYAPIFAAAKNSDVEWYFVEQEPPFKETPALEAIKIDYDYLHKMA